MLNMVTNPLDGLPLQPRCAQTCSHTNYPTWWLIKIQCVCICRTLCGGDSVVVHWWANISFSLLVITFKIYKGLCMKKNTTLCSVNHIFTLTPKLWSNIIFFRNRFSFLRFFASVQIVLKGRSVCVPASKPTASRCSDLIGVQKLNVWFQHS